MSDLSDMATEAAEAIMGAPGPEPPVRGSAHHALARGFAESLKRGGRPSLARMTAAAAATIPECPPAPNASAVPLVACGTYRNGGPVICIRWLIGKPRRADQIETVMTEELQRLIDSTP